MKKIKKSIITLLTVSMIISMLSFPVIAADGIAEAETGDENIIWQDEDHITDDVSLEQDASETQTTDEAEAAEAAEEATDSEGDNDIVTDDALDETQETNAITETEEPADDVDITVGEENVADEDVRDPEEITGEHAKDEVTTKEAGDETKDKEDATEEETTKKENKKTGIKKAASKSTTINITKAMINADRANIAINNALNEARQNATDSKPYTIKVAAGSYTIRGTLRVPSNTTLDLTGVTLINSVVGNMLCLDDYSGRTNEKGYYYKNITITGGTFDHKNSGNVCMKLGHAKNITLKNLTLKNANNSHLLETGGVSGLMVSGCTFMNQTIDKDHLFYEAIQIDIPIPDHFGVYKYEALTSKDITIEKCKFINVPRGVGTHTGILNAPYKGFVVRDCTFENCGSSAIQMINASNVTIKNNTIKNCPRGIAIFSILNEGSGTFLPSYIYGLSGSVKSGESSGLSDKYSAATSTVSNITIEGNTISLKGSEQFAKYGKAAIFVSGTKLDKTGNKYSDKSGGLPKGDYYVNDVTIKNNTITSNGEGIRFENTRGIKLSGNKIGFNIEGGDSDKNNYCGIWLRTDSRADSISSNTIDSAPRNGIFLNYASFATAISNNTIKSPGEDGIKIEESKATTISGNRITAHSRVGIFIYPRSEVKNITTNTILKGSNTTDNSICVGENSKVGTITKNLVSTSGGVNGIYIYSKSNATSVNDNAASSNKDVVYVASNAKALTNVRAYKVSKLFTDVMDANQYYCMPVYWASSKGITKGYPDGTFGPGKKCTRAHVVTFLWRLAGKPKVSGTLKFKDVTSKYKKTSDTYRAILWASKKGITNGYSDGTFKPEATCLREHVATFLWRYAGKPSVNGKKNPFNDVKSSDYFYKAVIWANSKGIAKGYSEGRYKGGFGPKVDCLREHVVTFIYRYKK